jgi:hypothetical protein
MDVAARKEDHAYQGDEESVERVRHGLDQAGVCPGLEDGRDHVREDPLGCGAGLRWVHLGAGSK